MFVDPLAEQFPGWSPYHYVHQNPINLIDPTGMSADGWIESYTEDGQTMLTYDADIDTKEQAVAKGYKNVRGVSESMYYDDGNKSYDLNKDGTVYDIDTGAIIDVGFDPIRTAEGYFISEVNGLKSTSTSFQDFGDFVTYIGLGASTTGVGSIIGLPLMAVGGGFSTVGTGIEITYLYSQGKRKKAITKALMKFLFFGTGKLAKDAAVKAVGSSLDSGYQTLIEGSNLIIDKTMGNDIESYINRQ